jgi:hypothetical protein
MNCIVVELRLRNTLRRDGGGQTRDVSLRVAPAAAALAGCVRVDCEVVRTARQYISQCERVSQCEMRRGRRRICASG